MRFLTRASDGGYVLASCHPKSSPTWHWSIGLNKKKIVTWGWRLASFDKSRTNQWHDYFRLPFGWTLIISRQDYHKATQP